MTDYSIHRPRFSGTTKNDWEFPTENEFGTDDLSSVADHFLLSASGFDDPEEFEDLALPVVSTRGELSLNGLWAARHGPYSVERIEDLDDDTEARVRELIDDLGNEHFEVFSDVTVTESEWAETTDSTDSTDNTDTSANPVSEIIGKITAARPTYSPEAAVVGLLFLVGASAVLAEDCDESDG